MKPQRILLPLMAAAALSFSGIAAAHGPTETVKENLSRSIPNIPGKSIVAVEVLYPPGGASLPHYHARSAFIYAYVVSGSIASKVDDGPERVYKAGESFHEEPGSHHQVSRNASRTKPAKLLAVFVMDSNEKDLTTHEGSAK
ncbi:cupin domain-containing protein [Cupriavidus consociatus]|uniref:cupin domain-containing protein n=1 Tax=Cupriavidus consociatus TaxID=2821357 RepID=UPI001AE34C9A|nr:MULTISPECIES: cupin domain-containing protein [unclassified Cupriavidus]MBP0620712.1 cupin domain-containing protein [Cupriavidus sp. LEh25]MDK2657372.1 cupin domain-containing protein [Cupriavidus sp. LEh21]